MFWSRLLAAKSNGKVLFSEVRRARVEAGRSLRDPVLGWGGGGGAGGSKALGTRHTL